MGGPEMNWRKATIHVLLVGMETSWFLPWAVLLAGGIGDFTLLEVALGVAALMLLALLVSLWVSATSLNLFQQQGVIFVTALLTAFLLVRFAIYGGYPLFQMSWLAAMSASLARALVAFPPEGALFILVFYLWWRGVSLSHRSLSSASVGFSFRAGVLMLLASSPVAILLPSFDARIPVLAFFFFGLLALAIARIGEAGLSSASDWRYWMAVLMVASALVLAAGVAFSSVYSLRGFQTLLRWLSPLTDLLGKVVFALLVLIGRALEPVMLWLIEYFRNLPVERRLQPVPPWGLKEAARPTAPVAIPGFIQWALKAFAMVIVLFLIWVAFSFVWGARKKEGKGLVREERERLPASLMPMVKEALRRIPKAVFPQPLTLPSDEVRAIYARLLQFSAERGFPRQPSQTPYEYLGVLERAFPRFRSELAAITEAYVDVRYGGAGLSPSRLEYVRRCWERLRPVFAGRGA